MDDWQPLEGSLLGEQAGALYEGVPLWLVSSLRDWVRPDLTWRSAGTVRYNVDTMHELERTLRTSFDWSADSAAVVSVMNLAVENPEVFLGAVDFLVHQPEWEGWAEENYHRIEQLERILLQGGSAWKVNDDLSPRLVRRVDATYEAAARHAMEQGKAGDLLRVAWTAAYGRDPQPSYAYQQAVRAVEAAAQPTILPANEKATLGQLVPAIKDKPDKWTLPIKPPGEASMVVVADMMQLVWKGQHDRHGTVEDGAPLHVELDEALAALPIAVALVELFATGAVQRKP